MTPVLHIHAQSHWHDDATIIGTRDALRALRVAIDTALTGDPGHADVFCADGEGYAVRVLLRDRGPDDPAWRDARLPYVAAMARGGEAAI